MGCCTSPKNGVVIATHARRHLIDDDDRMIGAPCMLAALRTPPREVLRLVDPHGSVSFAGTGYRVGNRYRCQTVGVRLVGGTVQIPCGGVHRELSLTKDNEASS